jgi:hypothetical protein
MRSESVTLALYIAEEDLGWMLCVPALTGFRSCLKIAQAYSKTGKKSAKKRNSSAGK